MPNHRRNTPLRRLRTVLGFLALAALAAGSADAQSVRDRERRVESAQGAVEKAEGKVEEAKQNVEKAKQAVEEEQQRLADEARRDPTAHGTQDELRQQKKELEKAEQELAARQEELAGARKKLAEARDKLIERLEKELGKPGLAEAERRELERKLEKALEAKLDEVDDGEGSAAEKQEQLEQLEDEIEDSKLDAESKADLRRKLRRILRDVFRDALEKIEGSEEPAADKRRALDDLEEEIEDSDLDDATKRSLLEELRRLLGSLSEAPDEESSYDQGARFPAPGSGSAVAGVPAPSGARVVLPGTVVAGEEATLAVLGPDGALLPGVVVEVDGERRVTDRNGRVLFRVAGTATGIVGVLLTGLGEESGGTSRVVPAPAAGLTGGPPVIDGAPRFASPGSELPIRGRGFSGDAAGNTVSFGDLRLPVLAASPTVIVTAAPADLPLGAASLTVETAGGRSAPASVTAVRIGLAAGPAHLRRGESDRVRVVVEGTREPVTLQVTNQSPAKVRLDGGVTTTAETRGGRDNSAEIRLTGVAPGAFQLHAEIVDHDEVRRLEEEANEASGRGWDLHGDGLAKEAEGDFGAAAESFDEAARSFDEAARAYDEAGKTAQARAERGNAAMARTDAREARAAAAAGEG